MGKLQQKHMAAAKAALGATHAPATTDIVVGEAYEHILQLSIDEIVASDLNPRTQRDEKAYADLKQSILDKGFVGSLIVTKINGKYTLIFGGNTRLEILKELYAEGHKQFAKVACHYTPFDGDDLERLALNYNENDQRSDICFWDKANTLMTMLDMYSKKMGGRQSAKKFIEFAHKSGMSTLSEAFLSYASFAVEYLSDWQHQKVELTLNAAKILSAHIRRIANNEVPDHIGSNMPKMKELLPEAIRLACEQAIKQQITAEIGATEVAKAMLKALPKTLYQVAECHAPESRKTRLKSYFSKLVSGKSLDNSPREHKAKSGNSDSTAAFSTAVENGKSGVEVTKTNNFDVCEFFGAGVGRNAKFLIKPPVSLKSDTKDYVVWWMLADLFGQFDAEHLQNLNFPEAKDWVNKIADETDKSELLEQLGGQPAWFGIARIMRDNIPQLPQIIATINACANASENAPTQIQS